MAVLKLFILSKTIYLWMLLPNPPDKFVNELQKTVFQFVWNRKQDRISGKTAVRSIAKGRLGIPSIKTYINAVKLIWNKLKSIITSTYAKAAYNYINLCNLHQSIITSTYAKVALLKQLGSGHHF